MKSKIISYIKQVFIVFGITAAISVVFLYVFDYYNVGASNYMTSYDRVMLVLFLSTVSGILVKMLLMRKKDTGAVKWLKYVLCMTSFIISYSGFGLLFNPFQYYYPTCYDVIFRHPALIGAPGLSVYAIYDWDINVRATYLYDEFIPVFVTAIYASVAVLIALLIVMRVKRKKDLKAINKKLAENAENSEKSQADM